MSLRETELYRSLTFFFKSLTSQLVGNLEMKHSSVCHPNLAKFSEGTYHWEYLTCLTGLSPF